LKEERFNTKEKMSNNYTEMMKKFKTKTVQKKSEGQKSEVNNDFLKLNNDGKSVLVRFLPDIKLLERTGEQELSPYTRFIHAVGDGDDYKTFLCPSTEGKIKDCSFCMKAIEIWKSKEKTPVQEAIRKKLNRRCEHLVNVYVIEDEANPENNGKVKILKFYSELWDKYEKVIAGKLKDRIWRLDGEGSTLRIECKIKKDKEGNEIPSYASSSWDLPEAIPGMTDEKANDILSKTFDITTLMAPISIEEINKMYQNIVGGTQRSAPKTETQAKATNTDAVVDDMLNNIGKQPSDSTSDDEEPLPF
jgi:hypothetical protein